ncbi:MAG: hypothetical protein ACOH5I_26720 [Oligoflexus sp.]
MALAKNLSDHHSGRVRDRRQTTKRKSHRVFKNWTYAADGTRSKPKPITHKFARYNADLTSTYYNNPARGTQTVHGLGFDIDLSRTNIKWLDEKGRVSWPKIGSFLAENEAQILNFITAVASSTSGKGLGLYLPISPLEIVSSTATAQKSARILQAHIITILNYHGIGADPGAMGLVRDIPNYFNPQKLIDSDLIGTDRLVDNRRYPVVAELLRYTNRHPAVRRLKSRDPKRLFSGHRTSEKKLALLYEYLLDEALESSIWLSGAEIFELTGLSKSTLYKFLSSKHEWLDIVNHGKAEGYELTFKPTAEHSERCYELLNGTDLDSDEKGLWSSFSDLEAPELVLDGERNDYLTRATIELKVKGVHYHDALAVMKKIAARIPGSKTSRNCRNVGSLVKSIYYHRIETFETNFNQLSLILQAEVNALQNPSPREFPKKYKKGTTVGSIQSSSSVVEEDEKVLSIDDSDRVSDGEKKKEIILPKGEPVRAGDLPPSSQQGASLKPQDRPEFCLLLAFAPAAARNIVEGISKPVIKTEMPAPIEKLEPHILAPLAETSWAKAKVYKTLKALRTAEYMDKDPIDRFARAFDRCLNRKTEPEILSAMVKVEPQIRLARRRGTIYEPVKGPYRRVLKAFSLLPEHIRLELLSGPRGV